MRFLSRAVVSFATALLFASSALAAETALSVFTYNAEVFSSSSATSNVIQQVDADIVGLQERAVFFFGGFDSSDAAALGYHYHQFGSTAANLNSLDTAVLSRFPIVETYADGVKVELAPGSFAYVFDVHLEPYPYQPYDISDGMITTEAQAIAAASSARGAGMASVLSQMSAPLSSGDPVFLVGDFNEPSHLDWTQAAANAGLNMGFGAVDWPTSRDAESAGLVDAFRNVRPDEVGDPGETWTPDPGANEVHDRIDMIYFAGNDLSVTDAEVVGENAANADLVVSPWVSDHRGVVVDFLISDPPPPCPSGDSDGDGACDDVDNCPADSNPDQLDQDSDDIGDVCDVCIFDANNDSDGDGSCDSVDLCTGDDTSSDTDADGLCNDTDTDDDNDGIADGPDLDALDPAVCADADADSCDDCAIGVDGFGALPDNPPANDGTDTDGDQLCNAGDPDDDGDGLSDLVETNTDVFVSPVDTGTDPLDSDTDGDGFGDGEEVDAGSDPNDAASTPGGSAEVPALTPSGIFLLISALLLTALGTRRRASLDIFSDPAAHDLESRGTTLENRVK